MTNFKKNDIVELNIIDLGINGEGIAKLGEKTIFVPFALQEEVVKAQIIKVETGFFIGKLIDVLKPSKHRVAPKCAVFTKCGGCQLQHLNYTQQLQFKTQLVQDTLKKVGNIAFEVNSCVPSSREYNYRNKISLPIRSVAGQTKIGLFAANSHRIVEIEECPLQEPLTNRVIKVFKEFMLEHDISAYDEITGKGLVRHLVAREFNNALLVCVVINGKDMPQKTSFYEKLKQNFENITLFLNHNTQRNNVILGKQNTLIGGSVFLIEQLQGITVETGIDSFMQINNEVRDKMYAESLQKVKDFCPKTIIDAYSGAGLLSGILAKNIDAKVYGLEIVKEAIDAANKMLAQNGLEEKVQNIQGDCTVTLPQLMREQSGKTTLILDPPRKGLDKAIIDAILQSKPQQIIYIACGLTSLSRDLGLLLDTKDAATSKPKENPQPIYELKNVTPYDMFPQTKHVETLVELTKK